MVIVQQNNNICIKKYDTHFSFSISLISNGLHGGVVVSKPKGPSCMRGHSGFPLLSKNMLDR